MTAAFDWNQFKEVSQTPISSSKSSSSFDFNQFPEVKSAPEKGLDDVKRHLTRSVVRGAEALAGAPGDVLNAPFNVARLAIPKSQQKNFDEVSKIAKFFLPGINLPTSSQLKETSSKLSNGYTDPKSEGEKKSDDIISDFVSLAIPIKGKIPFARSLGASIGSNLAEMGVKHLGGEEGAQTATKLGTAFLLTAINPKGANKYASSLFSEAESLLPKNAMAEGKMLSGELKNFKQELIKGGSAPSKDKSLKKIDEVLNATKNGRISVDELTSFKKSINEAREGLYQEFGSNKSGRLSAKRNLDRVSKSVDKALDGYGQTNPAWNKAYRSANEAHGAIQQSKKVGNQVARVLKQNPHLASGGAVAEIFFAPKTLPLVGAGFAGLKTAELLTRVGKSPVLRKYYSDVINAALKQDSAEIAKSLERFDSAIKSNK